MLAKVDSYGTRKGFNFEGAETFRTTLGGVMSILTMVLFLTYAIILVIAFWLRSEVDKFSYVQENGLDRNKTYSLNEMGFDFLFLATSNERLLIENLNMRAINLAGEASFALNLNDC